MLELKNISKRYVTQSFTQVALDSVSVSFRDNEFVAVLGPSGSGKTTMLNVVGGLDHFDDGDLLIDGISTKNYRDRDWDAYRNNRIGFVFQSYNLIPHQTILENVELALTLSGVGRAERRRRAREALEKVGLGQHVDKRPAQLSGGQMQRVAIARALINDPEIVLADEPTGALDSVTSVQVMDLLKEVAKDRLVIMVTHNPELAYQYATRIVNLADGRVMDDSDPFDAHLAPRREAKAGRRTSMSFLTALGLSARNLLTKKGRTAMTAFAGSIGIIGIAAILALSNGVNEYIARVEEETLSSYPLTISKQSYDMSSMLDGSSDDSSGAGSDKTGASEATAQNGQISVVTSVKDMFGSVKSNDMKDFKEFLDAGWDGMDADVNSVQYSYDVSPIIYKAATGDASAQKLVPNRMTESLSTGMASMMSSSTSGTDVFNEMLDDPELVHSQYNVVAGRWAESADEAVLVLSKNGSVSDYTLYSIGALDIEEMNDLVQDSLSGNTGEVTLSSEDATFTYDDALSCSFKVLSASDCYRKNDETGGWTDMSDDSEYMVDKVESGLDLRIVGVVQPNDDSSSTLSPGVAYTHALSLELMERAAGSQIVQQQISDPDRDVFTGKTFSELQDEAKEGVDLENMFSIDEEAIQQAFKFDESAISGLTGEMDLSGMDLSNIDLSGMNIDLSGVGSDIDFSSISSGAPAPDLTEVFKDTELTAEQMQAVGQLSVALYQGFLQSDEFKSVKDPTNTEEVNAAYQKYLAENEDAKTILTQIGAIGGASVAEKLQAAMSDYMQNTFAPYLQQSLQQAMSKMSEEIASAVSIQIKAAMTQVMDQIATQMTESITAYTEQLSGAFSNLESAFSVDSDAFASAITFNMDAEDLASLISSYSNANKLTYENNLSTLGYADESDPSSVSIYPVDFEAKERVLNHIDAYNEQVKAAGDEGKAIVYTDYVGMLMTSVTDIVNMISLVLIAFVSISLVVSSIMIGIITYISVLERKKEIGILRAIGASKGNVANVFNAETFIEGLIAGVFAILVVVLVSIPVNAAVLEGYGVENIMSLPPAAAGILILISIVLTVVAGLLPAHSASKKDPVEALRSE
ncbi:ABC transporter ATP-binding protein/permease [Paratractidigestivibacter sp.]|uniref:ABC transporter ATP-binding protein/permease n=1 Tax=Paratractidigestivibacter sp. TaxID=2847316 RepID=UPI002ABD6363|nr:ABC transporter ATP-binding protein/permease [Paratractidigestivibacter sp.]